MKSSLLAQLIQNRKKACWELIHRKYPEKHSKYDITRMLVEASIKELENVKFINALDTGCGHETDPLNFKNIICFGTDMVFKDLKENTNVKYKFVSDIEKLPLRKESLDIVFSNMVIEHLKDPYKYFETVFNSLKPGGYVVFSTPCIYNIVVLINRVLPNRFSQKLGNMLTNTNESDIFSTHYKANSIKKIRSMLGNIGYKECDLIMHQPPPYAFVFSKVLCTLVINYYYIINKYSFLKCLRGVIISRYKKPSFK